MKRYLTTRHGEWAFVYDGEASTSHRLSGLQTHGEYAYMGYHHRLDGYADTYSSAFWLYERGYFTKFFTKRSVHAEYALKYIHNFNKFDSFEKYGKLT